MIPTSPYVISKQNQPVGMRTAQEASPVYRRLLGVRDSSIHHRSISNNG